jgi:hypothetical protein
MDLRKIICVVALYLVAQLSCAQNAKLISGKLYAKNKIPQNVRIINLVSEQETVSDQNGEFKILVKKEDLLVFSSLNFDYVRKIIEQNDIEKGEININLVEKIEQLEEVKIVNYANINAVSLGILSQPAKEYTPAERRLETAGDFKWYYPIMIPFGGMPTEGLINKITGRRKKLEKELKVERKELLIKKLENDFSLSFYLKNLKLKPQQVKAFQYYCAEDEDFATILKQKNKTQIMLKLSEMAAKFRKLNEKN